MLAQLLISSNLESRITYIQNILEKYDLKTNHPDVFYLENGQKLGVEQSKKIREFLSLKPFQSQHKAVIIENADVLTLEAQTSLLKSIEELPENTLLIFGSSSKDNLLPTVISRCKIVILEDRQDKPTESIDDIGELIIYSIAERFTYIEKLKEKEQLLQALILYFRKKLLENPTVEYKNFLKDLLEAEKWAKGNVNIRAILEYLMLVMPNGK